MPLTPGSAQLPLLPNKQWLYLNTAYTDGIIGDAAKEESLLCYAYAQGYTGIVIYELKLFLAGNTNFSSTVAAKFNSFILKAYNKNIEIAGAFGGPTVLSALINYNNTQATSNIQKFKAVVSEIEWWLYSFNLPFQQPVSGAYSYYDTLNLFKTYKSALTSSGLELYTYNGWTKAADYKYVSGFKATTFGTNSITIAGNFTSNGASPIDEDNLFEPGQIIRVENFPVMGNHTYYQLTSTTLFGGNTILNLATGKECSGVDDSSSTNTLASGTPTGATFTTINGARTTTATNVVYSYSSTLGNYIATITTSSPHLITPSTFVQLPNSTILKPSPFGSSSSGAELGTSGNTLIISSPVFPISTKASTGSIATITTTNPHYLVSGLNVSIGGVGTGYDGIKTITVLNSNTFTFTTSANAEPTTPVTSGTYRVTSGSVTFSPPVTLSANNVVNSKVRNVLQVKSITPVGPIYEMRLHGNKTFYAANGRLKKVSIFGITGGDGLFDLANSNATYDSINNETVFQLAGTYPGAGTSQLPGFMFAAASFDVVTDADGTYGPGSELQQCIPYVNNFWLHSYVQVPNYNYVQSRTIELGQGGVAQSQNVKVSWIVSAEGPGNSTNIFSKYFFEGKDNSGVVVYNKKNPIDAYKYINYTITPTPAPAQVTPLASSEPNSDVQARIYIDGIVVFKDTLIRNLVSGDGPNIWVDAGADVSLTANSGTVSLLGTYCDDCLPSNNFSYSWSVVSANPVGGGTVSPSTGTLTTGCVGNQIAGTFTFTSAGSYTVRLTVTDNSGTPPFSTGQDDLVISIAPLTTGPFDITVTPVSYPTCSYSTDPGAMNDGSITVGITAAQAPVKPVTYNLITSSGTVYNATGIDNSPGAASSYTFTNVPSAFYYVTAVDSALIPRTGDTLNNIIALYPQYNLQSLLTFTPTYPTCYGGTLEGLVTISDPNYCPAPVFTDIIPDYDIANPASFTLTGTWYFGFPDTPGSITPGLVTLENTQTFNPLVTYNEWAIQAAGVFLPATDTFTVYYEIETGAWPQNNTTINLRDKFGANVVLIPAGTIAPSTLYTGTQTFTGQGTFALSTVEFHIVDNTVPVSGRYYELTKLRLKIQTGNSSGTANLFFDWSTGFSGYGETFETTDQLESPAYFGVEVTDCHGCTALLGNNLTWPLPIIPTITSTDTTCGLSNGTATISNIANGSAPYTYLWSDGQTNSTAIDLAPGFYSVVVTDKNGCTGVSNAVEILSSTGISIGILSPPAVACCGQDVNISAVTGLLPNPITVEWSNGDMGLSATYNFDCKDAGFINIDVTVTDDVTGCSYTDTATIEVKEPVKSVSGIKVLSGDPNGLTGCTGDYVEITTIGGTGVGEWNFGAPPDTTLPLTVDAAWFNTYGTPGQPFTFTWSEVDPVTTCYSEASITINYPITVELEIDVIPVICGGSPTGGGINIEILSSCGAPYDVTWTGPVSGSDTFSTSTYSITNLTTGFYTVSVEDVEGNIKTVPDINVYVDTPEITDAVVTNYCFNVPVNSNTGAIDITVAGGTPPYTYAWTKTGNPAFTASTEDLTNIGLGEYTVVVTDDNGCTVTDTYKIEYQNKIEINISFAGPSCWGICNGVYSGTITGGTAPYDIYEDNVLVFLGSTGSFGNKGICSRAYTIKVVDANGCEATKQFNAGAGNSIITFTDRVVDPVYGSNQLGAIYIDTIQGGINPSFPPGNPPYLYYWTGPNGFTSNSQDITNLAPGEYTVEIEANFIGFGAPQCRVSKTYKLKSSCPDFSIDELKVMLFKFQCCAGVLAKEYVQYQEIGRPDLAECLLVDLKYLTLAINSLSCINELPDACLSCEDISNIISQIKKICDCDCCDDNATSVYNVSYNPFTGQLDSN